jgi:acetyl esterase/lipase
MLTRRTALLGTLALGLAARAAAQTRPPSTPKSPHLTQPDPTETIDLWPGRPPGSPATLPVEQVEERSTDPAYKDRFVTGTSRPRMAVFRPKQPNGAAALIIPGGGYERVVIDKEGYELARWLSERGITAFVLFYRLPHQGWADRANTPLADAQRAIRLIRNRAGAYQLDPAKVVAIGFSAGGHLCADLMTRFSAAVYPTQDAADRLSARPDAAAPCYPVVSLLGAPAHSGSRKNLLGDAPSEALLRAHSPHLNVPADAPPAFLVHAEDDGAVPVENTLLLRAALRARGIATETHIFPDGGHGFGLRLARGKSPEGWQELLHAWARRLGLFA